MPISFYLFKSLIFFNLTILFSCSNKSDNKLLNEEYVNKISIDTLVQRTDTIIGYITKYSYDDINKRKHGAFESFFFENGKILSKACEANYENGFLKGQLTFYDESGKIITKYENLTYDIKSKTYTAKILVYDKNYKLKEEGLIKTTDELDFSPIFDDSSCCFEKNNLDEWKYYN